MDITFRNMVEKWKLLKHLDNQVIIYNWDFEGKHGLVTRDGAFLMPEKRRNVHLLEGNEEGDRVQLNLNVTFTNCCFCSLHILFKF